MGRKHCKSLLGKILCMVYFVTRVDADILVSHMDPAWMREVFTDNLQDILC